MIHLNDLSVGYSKSNVLLEHVNEKFDGTITGILGESGIGKTTLFKTICGLIPPLSGTVQVDGKDIKSSRDSHVVMMCQKNTNFDWLTCLDNILIVDKIRHSKIGKEQIDNAKYFLDRVGLLKYQNRYPRSLSGGEQQRLSLARILYMEPMNVMMDEPLSALDETTRANMQELIIQQHKKLNNTILLVTHSSDEARKMCDNISTLFKKK